MRIKPGNYDEVVRRPDDVGHPKNASRLSEYWTQEQSYTATCEANVSALQTGYPVTVTNGPRQYYPPTTLAAANAASLAEVTANAISQLSCCNIVQAAVTRVYDPSVSPWVVTPSPQLGASTGFSGSGLDIIYSATTNPQFGPLGAGGNAVTCRFVNTGRRYRLRYEVTGVMGITESGGVTFRFDINQNATPLINSITQAYDRTSFLFPRIYGEIFIPQSCNTFSISSSITTALGFSSAPDTQIASGQFRIQLTTVP